MKRRHLLVAVGCAVCRSALADRALALPPAPAVALHQRLGAQLPMDLSLTDEHGEPVVLGIYLRDKPTLLVLRYYRCPQLCGLLMHGVLEALPREGARIVSVSIDPDDTPGDARARRAVDLAYWQAVARPGMAPPELHVLTGGTSIARLTAAAGFEYQAGAPGDAARFAHAAGVVVVSPGGRIAQVLPGVRFDAAALRDALSDAAQRRVGSISERIALLCAHFDPDVGRWSIAVLDALRATGIALLGALCGAWWRQRRHSRVG